MHEANINLLREEAQRLLKEEVNLLEKIKGTPNVLTAAGENAQTLDLESLPKAIERLQDENHKLDSLELVLAVVGTMKAGKSTTINAIVGMEVLPNRNRPMTALPTLIRHTPSVTEPRLIFNNTNPVNQLIKKLNRELPKASTAVLNEIDLNTDMQELLERIKSLHPFVEHHEGAEAIFNFLKSLNDLVRLSTLLNVEFPFEAYSRIESLPLIEVEFTHLSQMGHAQGRLTLLDTPGPNEAGQDHLRPMLRDQLKKASAVLAVLDYTQLKSDADHEMRENLEEVAKVTGDRLYALVNRFDQKDRNSDSSDDVRKYVSSNLMKGLIATERVYPVSARFGYLASQAKNELALRGRLPCHETHDWVADFAKLGIGGRRWEDKLENADEVAEAANYLWEESQFNEPLEHVIRQAYGKAAILAIDSTAAKMVDLAENAKNFLGTRKQAFKRSVEEIQRQVASLQNDIESIKNEELSVKNDAESALNDVKKGIQSAGGRAQKDTLSILDKYFKEGKRIEANKRAEKAASAPVKSRKSKDELNVNQGGLRGFLGSWETTRETKDISEQDFDSTDKPIKFDDKEDAKKLIARLEESIGIALNEAEDSLQDDIKQQIELFNQQFHGYVGRAEELIKNIKKGMYDFDLIIRLPDAKSVHLGFDMSEILNNAAQEKTEERTRERRKTGLWGKICGAFGTNDWGWEKYSEDVEVYLVDIKAIRKDVIELISRAFSDMEKVVSKTIEVQLNEQTDSFFSVLREKVEHIRGDLISSMSDREKSQKEQNDLLGSLTKLERPVSGLLKDSEALVKEVKGLLAESGVEK